MIVRPSSRVGPLPNFLIIGAMKAGTTALYHYLRAHPHVHMPPFKAPEFFVAEAHWDRGIDWYRRQFAGADPGVLAIGEASSAYTKYPRFRGVPERIAAHIPDIRMVYVLRDPIDRIRSQYQTRVWQGDERAPIDRALFEDPRYLNYSRYWLQLEQYLPWFDRDQLLVITAEDLRDARIETIRRVYGFIGVDATFTPENADREFYRSGDHGRASLVPLAVRKALKAHFPAAKRAKELENHVFTVLDAIRRKRSSEPRPPIVVPDEVRARLVEMLRDDVRQLCAFLGPDFHGWGIA